MGGLAQLAGYAFRRAWLATGQPSLFCVRPVSVWTGLSGYGYAYDATVDRVVDTSGVVLDDPSPYWTTDTVNCVPAAAVAELVELTAGGLAPDGTAQVMILAADIATLRAAPRVQLGGCWYHVVGVEPEPPGAAPAWATVRLQRRQ
jgi:hypothetical protein